MNALGKHLLLELRDCDREVLNDLDRLQKALIAATEEAGATVIGKSFHQFSPQGVSGVVLLAESHLCLHTWPEYNYAAADVFTCGDSVEPRVAAERLIRELDAKAPTMIEMSRGVLTDLTWLNSEDEQFPQKVEGFSGVNSREYPNKWFQDFMSPDLVQLFALKETVYSQKTKFQRVEVIETQHFGRCLVLDGKIQSSEKDEFIYHEALVHPPMVIHPCPEKVFIAGGGEGATLREVLAYRSVGKVVMVDIDAESVDICRRFLPSWHQGSFEDKRVELLHLDAREYLKKAPEKFDVIILDLTDPLKGSPSCLLYTQQFYQLAQERLTHQGVLSVQANSCSLGESRIFVAIINTLRSAFPSVFPYQTFIPSFGSLWGFALAGEELAEPLSLSCQEIDSCITSRITKKLNFYDGLTHQGMFSLPKHLREEIGQERRIITDENPIFPSWVTFPNY